MTLGEARRLVGRYVLYQAAPHLSAERGRIDSVDDKFVYVEYPGHSGVKATRPQDLRETR